MATVNKTYMAKAKQFGGAPFGNQSVLPYKMILAAGVFTDSDQTTTLAIGDVVRLGIIPAGTLLTDAQTTVSAVFTALTTANIGFLYTDGVDSVVVPQDAAYFAAALALSAAGVSRKTGTKAPLTLPKDAHLVITIAGAAQTLASQLDIIVHGIQTS
jgi:hypothetical protein